MADRIPDRYQAATEQRLAAAREIDTLDAAGVLRIINQQDATVAAAVAAATADIARLVEAVIPATRLIYLGAGTSGRLGVLDASECPPTFFCDPGEVVGIIAGGDTALRQSSEGAEDDPDGAAAQLQSLGIGNGDMVVGIAAGGSTPYVLGGVAIAKQRGAVTGLIACTDIEAEVDHPIVLRVGPEVVTGSTRMKAGTATKLVLNMITTATMICRGKTWGNLMVDLRATNAKLRDRAARIVTSQTDLSRDAAMRLIDDADGRVKVALVMAIKNVNAQAARAMIDEHHGLLRAIIGAPK